MRTARKSDRNNSYLSIRSKLMAAVAMLLVASFMVVSSSYAWFTLSTAPEVKGIQTSVGANGNLEIALYTGDTISSGVGDTNEYETWGNLVDVSNAKYGLDAVSLLPARLNVNSESKLSISNPLQTPVYGADGRVEKLDSSTMLGAYDASSTSFKTAADPNDPDYGVRAIGNTTAMTQQQIDYRTAQVNLASALAAARTRTSESLTIAGSDLATMAATKATGSTNATYDLSKIKPMLDKLDAAVAQLDTAFLNFVRANYAAGQGSTEEETYNTNKADYFDDTKAADNLATWVTGINKDNVKTAWNYRNYIKASVDDAKTKYDALGEKVTAAEWTDVTTVLGKLVDLESVKINDMDVDTITESTTDENGETIYPNMNQLVNDVAGGKGITVQITEATADANYGSGVYCDMAKLCGNFTASIQVEKISYKGLSVGPVNAKMVTKLNPAPAVNLITELPEAPSGSASSTGIIINDLYGYVIDLAFRTNAVDSSLLLQTSKIDRIYSSGGSALTQGEGSTMSFSSLDTANFPLTKVKDLMAAIRIVFYDTIGGKIFAVAGLNTYEATDDTTKVTAPIQVYDETTYDLSADGGFKVVEGKTLAFEQKDSESAALTELEQNITQNVSVLVYLDGDHVQNSDVANAAKSMYGTMNLQFSSSAKLVPMNYAPLQDAMSGGSSSDSDDTTLTVNDMPATATAGTELALPATDSANNALTWTIVNAGDTGATITDNKLTATAAGTVTVKGTAADGKTTAVQTITVSAAG